MNGVTLGAAEAGMHAQGSAIVARAGLVGGIGGVTLVAIAHAGIGGNSDRFPVFADLWMRHVRRIKKLFLAPVVESKRSRLIGGGLAGERALGDAELGGWSRGVNLVAGQAGYGGDLGLMVFQQMSGAAHVARGNQILDGGIPKHPMASETIIHGRLDLIVRAIQENVPIGGRMPARGPVAELGFMAVTTLLKHDEQLVFFQPGILEHVCGDRCWAGSRDFLVVGRT